MADRDISRLVVGVGAGGHAVSVLNTLFRGGRYRVYGLLDPAPERMGTTVLGVPVLGGDELLARLWQRGIRQAFIGVGSNGSTAHRRHVWESLQQQRFRLIDVVDPSAVVSPHIHRKRGITILARAVVNAGVRLGENVIVNTGAIVEHDCEIADHVHVATAAVVTGGVRVDAGAFIGAGACIRPGVHIGTEAVVGAGAVVVDDVKANSVVAGVPARELDKGKRSWMIRRAS